VDPLANVKSIGLIEKLAQYRELLRQLIEKDARVNIPSHGIVEAPALCDEAAA
jgi:hypothetical protein